MTGRSPSLVISLDFELRWGVHDSQGPDVDAYRSNLEGTPDAVARMLELFVEHDVHATWATVGALACEDWDDYFARAPDAPRYVDRSLAFDPRWADRDPGGAQHFAPRLVEAIAQTPGQEVGTHTFGHIFYREPGVMKRDVAADTAAAADILARRSGYTPCSLVFPRNQVQFVDVLAAGGISVARSEAPGWWWQRTAAVTQSQLVRGLRLMSTFRPRNVQPAATDRVCMLPASTFVRFNLPEPAFDASCRAVAAQARRLRDDESLHVWFHPHNLGDDPVRKVARLERMISAIRDAAPPEAQWRAFRDFTAAA